MVAHRPFAILLRLAWMLIERRYGKETTVPFIAFPVA